MTPVVRRRPAPAVPFWLLLAAALASAAPAAGQVVIRERVEVAPPRAPGPVPSAAATTGATVGALCGGPVVGYVAYYARGGRGGSAWVSGAELDGALDVQTACGGGGGPLAGAFLLGGVWEGHHNGYDRYNYSADTVAIVRVPLRPLDTISARLTVPGAGLDLDATNGWIDEFGCGYSIWGPNTCVDESPHPIKGGSFGIDRVVEGGATGVAPLQPDWPEAIECGTSAPIPTAVVDGSGAEAWLAPDRPFYFWLPFEENEPVGRQGTLTAPGGPDGPPGTSVSTDYGASRSGRVELVAPPCSAVRGPRSVYVRGSLAGAWNFTGWVEILPLPPVRFDVTLAADTVSAGETTWVTTVAVADDGAEVSFPDTTAVTLTARPAGAGRFAPYYVAPGPVVTVPYRGSSWANSQEYSRGYIPYQASASAPTFDTAVDVTSSGGGLTGKGTIVVRGTNGRGPDSLSVAIRDLDCGDSTAVFVRPLVAGQPTTLLDTTQVLLSVRGAAVGLSWTSSEGILSRADSLVVPYGDLVAGRVYVVGADCEQGESGVGVVTAEIDAPWSGDGVDGDAPVVVGSPPGADSPCSGGSQFQPGTAGLRTDDPPCAERRYTVVTKAELRVAQQEACPNYNNDQTFDRMFEANVRDALGYWHGYPLPLAEESGNRPPHADGAQFGVFVETGRFPFRRRVQDVGILRAAMEAKRSQSTILGDTHQSNRYIQALTQAYKKYPAPASIAFPPHFTVVSLSQRDNSNFHLLDDSGLALSNARDHGINVYHLRVYRDDDGDLWLRGRLIGWAVVGRNRNGSFDTVAVTTVPTLARDPASPGMGGYPLVLECTADTANER